MGGGRRGTTCQFRKGGGEIESTFYPKFKHVLKINKILTIGGRGAPFAPFQAIP